MAFGEQASFKASGEAHDFYCLYKGIRIHPFSPMPSPSSARPFLSSSTQALIFLRPTKHSNHVRIHKMIFTHRCRENDISQMQSANNFLRRRDMLLRSDHYSNRFPTTSHSAYCEAVSLTRLVKAEIMSPYYGISINMGMGNPTAQSIVALGK